MAAKAEANQSRLLNPWLLHLQKLGLELKCPLCLNLYNNPMLLPCNHIFCSSCLPESDLFGSGCLLCKLPYAKKDLREVPFVENVVNIYRCLDGSFSKHMVNSGTRVLEQNLHSTKPNISEQHAKKTMDSPAGNLTSENVIIQSMGTKRIHASNNSSFSAMKEKADKHVMDGNTGHSPTYDSNLSSNTHSQHGVPALLEHEAEDFEMNQTELSPDSPSSSGISKGAEIDGHDLGSSDNQDAVKCVPENSAKRNILDLSHLNEVPDACHKKQKQLHQDLPKMHEGHSHLSVSTNMKSTSTGANMNSRFGFNGGDQSAVEFDSKSSVNFTCAFCQSWKITEGSGPMHHFVHGKQVFGSDVGRSSVIHVHKSCIDWAPQIFYESDTVVKNIEKELARASKLKCTSCGLKGAALGCFAKSCRRTYHVPCAYEISKCRWDSDEFLMLCPTHSSQRFPSERSKKSALKKCSASAQNFVDTQKDDVEESNVTASAYFWASSPSGPESWVLCGSALSAEEKLMLVKFAKLCGATVTKAWNPNVTHVIAATDANGASSRTLKVLMAILNGKWILKTDWVKACMQSKGPVDEEPYEISLDNHGYSNGPKTGRLRVSDNAPQLFSGLKFLFTGEFVPAYKNDIENLIRVAGGTILESREQLQPRDDQSTSSTIVIYNSDATMNTEDVSQIARAQEEAKGLASETGSEFIPHTWILDSISSCTLQPFSQK